MTDTHSTEVAAKQWDGVAEAWEAKVDDSDDLTVPATTAWLDRLAVHPGERLLELSAGPGSMATTWSELVGPDGHVTVSDLAPRMVDAARRRAAGLANVEVAVIDLMAIDRADASYDVVASRMGLMFTPDPAVALAEMRRVLVDGGRMASLVWGGLEHNPWVSCVGMAAMLNGVVSGGPPVGPGQIFTLGDPDRLATLASQAGFAEVAVEAIDVTFTAPDIDAHLDRVVALAGPLAAALATATPDQLAAVRATATDLAAPHLTDDGLALPGRALLVSGRR
jgi:SAM-dependent methyltransferase